MGDITIEKGESIMRDCENCVYAKPYGGENDNRCSAWSCEFIDRAEAIEAYETLKAMRGTERMMGKARIDQYGYIPKGE